MAQKKKKEFKELPLGENADQTQEFKRGIIYHLFRWVSLSVALTLFGLLLLTSYNSHVLLHQGFNLKELIIYVVSITMFCIGMVPTVILEVNYVKASPDKVVFKNLLLSRTEDWSDLLQIADPRYLKYVMVRSKTFIYLLNRHDIGNFDKLVETIKEKAINAKL